MVDEPGRSAEVIQLATASRTPGKPAEFSNVEFLDTSLTDPTTVLRKKLKELSELPEEVTARRVLIITEVIDDEGRRGLDVTWSDSSEEPDYVVVDSVVSMLSRVHTALLSGSSED